MQLALNMSVAALKAMAEPTRLRLLVLLAAGELSVKDLTGILGQSQPRISRHLKLLAEAGLVERAPEGSWVYFRLAEGGQGGTLARLVLEAVDRADPVLARDRRRAEALREERERAAQAYFQAHAGEWDSIRALHVAEAEVEAAVTAALGPGPFGLLVDLGTGTGRMLELLRERYRRGVGIDLSPAMLAYARAKLERTELRHAQVRQGDIYDLPLADQAADAAVMHQVLHFLSDPQRAVREAARVLAPGGRLLIVDFAPHELEYLREQYAHERLGLAGPQVEQWLADGGLQIIERRDLVPDGTSPDAKLTVSVWVAGRPPREPATGAKIWNSTSWNGLPEMDAPKERRSRLVGDGDINVSFEFFPPKTEKMEEALWAAIRRLEPLKPRFVSVTYGAGGSTRERTHTTVARLVRETTLVPAAHLTCVQATKAEVDEVVRGYEAAGVRHIVALRGDPPAGVGTAYSPHPGGYANAADLVAGLKQIAGLEVSVAGYPERHPDSPSLEADLDNLKAKVDAGAARIITQFFFDNAHFLRFLEAARAHGIWAPIVPGIVPIHNFKQVAGFAGRCGATMPSWLARRFDGLDADPQTTHLVAAAVAAEQVMDLVDEGIRQFHFYTLNRADLVYAICHLLGLRPEPAAAKEAVNA